MLGTFDNNPMYGLNVSSKLFDGVNRYVRITDIDDDTHDLVSNDICSPSSFTKNYLLSEGDLLFARTGASVGKTYLYNSIHGLQYFAGYLIKFHFKDNLVAKYVFYSTQTTRYKNWVNVFSKRSGQPGINSEEYSKFEIYLPKSNELKKIVSFFELLERKIQIVDAKCEALKKYRKGIINSWFKNNGKTLRLCEVVTQQTSQLLTHQIKDNIGTYPVYDATGNIYKSIDFYMNANDSIAIIKYGSGCGRTFITHDKHCVLGTMSELIPLNHRDLTYIFAFTESSKFKKICKKYIEVGTTPNLYYSDYSTELVYYPDERNNFVELIDLISKKRVYLETEKEKLNQLKRQLLKDMFI